MAPSNNNKPVLTVEKDKMADGKKNRNKDGGPRDKDMGKTLMP